MVATKISGAQNSYLVSTVFVAFVTVAQACCDLYLRGSHIFVENYSREILEI